MIYLLVLLLLYQEIDIDTHQTSNDQVEIQHQETEYIITTRGPNSLRVSRYDANFHLQELTDTDDKEKIHILRQGDKISITCTRNGKTKTKVHKNVQSPWIQELYFGLKSFTLSGKSKLKYVSINPDDLSMIDMVLTRKELETIEGKNAVKLHMTVDGWKSRFWEAWGWTDPNTGLLIQKKANKGPFTPTMITKIQGQK